MQCSVVQYVLFFFFAIQLAQALSKTRNNVTANLVTIPSLVFLNLHYIHITDTYSQIRIFQLHIDLSYLVNTKSVYI